MQHKNKIQTKYQQPQRNDQIKYKVTTIFMHFIIKLSVFIFYFLILFTDHRNIIIMLVHKELFTLRSFCGIIFSLSDICYCMQSYENSMRESYHYVAQRQLYVRQLSTFVSISLSKQGVYHQQICGFQIKFVQTWAMFSKC